MNKFVAHQLNAMFIKQIRYIVQSLSGALVAFQHNIVCVISFICSSDNRKHCDTPV